MREPVGRAARDGERDYMRALEVLGADATAEQKLVLAAFERAGGKKALARR